MAQPGTNKQIPDHSIMDHFHKQVYLGNQYIVDTDSVSLSGTTETPILYILNPAISGSAFPNGVSLFNGIRRLYCNDVSLATGIIFRVYANPTTVSGGSAMTPVNCRFASTSTSIASVLKSPTVGGNGTLIDTIAVGFQSPSFDDNMFVIDNAKSLLITAQATASTKAIVVASWYEI